MRRVVAAAVLAGACGRIDFTPLPDAIVDGTTGGDVAPSADLLLHFTFEPGALLADRALVPHDGTCATGRCPTPTAGRIGQGAALFDATQCIEIPSSRTLQPGTFTFAAWLRPRVSHHGTALGRSREGTTTMFNTFEVWVDTSPSWNLAVQGGRTGGDLAFSEWHHYAGTYDGTNLTAYRDGVFSDTTPGFVTTYTADDLTIGCDLNLGALVQRFDGAIDDVRLYDRVLLPAEIAALAQ